MSSRPRRSRYTPAASGSKWIAPATRWAIYHRDGFACVYCESVGPVLSLDHVTACVRGARRSDPRGLVTCCYSCNSSKQGLSVREWFARLRARGIDTDAVRRRIARLTQRELDRARGRFLARSRSAA